MKVLIVEDDESNLETLGLVLNTLDIECSLASTLSQAFTLFLQVNPDIVLLDLVLKDGIGTELIDRISQSYLPIPPFIAISGYPNAMSLLENRQVKAFLSKPFDLEKLTNALK